MPSAWRADASFQHYTALAGCPETLFLFKETSILLLQVVMPFFNL
jgi:hypothetical protein